MSFECGLNSRRGIKADDDSPAVKVIRDAGAIVLCVSSVPELCLSYETHHPHYGRTLNPYDTSRTCGGSSGGEGALLGAAAAPFGMGSDFFGSIRIPSAFNGIFGLRTTNSLIDRSGIIPYSDDERITWLLSFGPMVRYAKDLRFLLKICARDNAKLISLDTEVKMADLRVLYVPEYLETIECVPMDEEVKTTLERAVNEFRQIGAKVVALPKEVNMDHLFEKCVSRMHKLPRRPLIEWSDISKKPDIMWGIYKEIAKLCVGMSSHTIVGVFTELMIRAKKAAHPEQNAYFVKLANKLQSQLEVSTSYR